MTPYVDNGIIQAPVYIYRVHVLDVPIGTVPNLYEFKEFLTRRIEEDGYVAECFCFEVDYEDQYARLVARPYDFRAFWLQSDDDEWGGDYG